MYEALFYVTGALSVGLLILVLGRHEKLGEAVSQVEAFKRESAKLEEKLKKEAENTTHLLRQLAANYDQRVDGEQKKIEEIRLSHEEWRDVVIRLVMELNRVQPGWSEKHGDVTPQPKKYDAHGNEIWEA